MEKGEGTSNAERRTLNIERDDGGERREDGEVQKVDRKSSGLAPHRVATNKPEVSLRQPPGSHRQAPEGGHDERV
jgi:hypothetical protein